LNLPHSFFDCVSAPGNEQDVFEYESYMKLDGIWSEKLMLAVLGLLILVAAMQIALRYVR
jgi:hypothetical protein